MCIIGPKGEASTHKPHASSVPEVKLVHMTHWPGRGVLGKKIRPTFFCLNLMYISQLTMSRSISMSGLVKVPFLGTQKWSEMAFYTINLREWILFETLKNAQLVL